MMKMKHLAVVTLGLLLLTPCAYGSRPLDAVRKPVDSVISILKASTNLPPEELDAAREKIRTEIKTVFDFTEMSKRTLARNWKDFSKDEQDVFTTVFGRLLEDTYIDKVLAGFEEEEVVYVDEKVTDDKAVVQTKILRRTLEIPVDYSLIRTESGWHVYDVRIEGVSLVKNYRSQFNNILRKDSPATLIQRIEEKIELLRKSRESALSKSSSSRMLGQETVITLLEGRSPISIRL